MPQALGRQAYAVNPKRCLCPFISKSCKADGKGTVDLNRLNGLSSLVTHLKTQHGDLPAAVIAARVVISRRAH